MISTGHRIPLGSQQQLNLCCPHLATSCDFTSSLSVFYVQSCIICLFLYCNLLIKYHMYVDIIPNFLSELSGIGIPKPPRKWWEIFAQSMNWSANKVEVLMVMVISAPIIWTNTNTYLSISMPYLIAMWKVYPQFLRLYYIKNLQNVETEIKIQQTNQTSLYRNVNQIPSIVLIYTYVIHGLFRPISMGRHSVFHHAALMYFSAE